MPFRKQINRFSAVHGFGERSYGRMCECQLPFVCKLRVYNRQDLYRASVFAAALLRPQPPGMPGIRGSCSCLLLYRWRLEPASRHSISLTDSICILGYSIPRISSPPTSGMKRLQFRGLVANTGCIVINPAMSAVSLVQNALQGLKSRIDTLAPPSTSTHDALQVLSVRNGKVDTPIYAAVCGSLGGQGAIHPVQRHTSCAVVLIPFP